jgi:phytoene synthase
MTNEMLLISKAGKTFYFATFWLSKAVRHDAARAYDFCRSIDDIADTSPARPDRDSYLSGVISALLGGDNSQELVYQISPLLTRFPSIRQPLAELVEACRLDVPSLTINSEGDLEAYAHGVAGNVGLIMYPILGGTSHLGLSYAADLGIAMQYTNIARDVLEDLERGRVYLPAAWISETTLNTVNMLTPKDEHIVVGAIKKLLLLADERYRRGLSGLCYLARENRFAIRVAAECYRAIGDRVISASLISRKRAVVSSLTKAAIACKAALHHRSTANDPLSIDTAGIVRHPLEQGRSNVRQKTGVS